MDISKIQLDDGVYNIKDSQARQDINSINNSIDNIKADKRKILFIGDSYLEMNNGSTGIIDKFKSISGINNVIYSVLSGTGFAYTVDNQNFISLLNNVTDDNNVTDIIVVGGYNDQYSNKSTVQTAIQTFINTAKTKFPNAKIYIAFAGFTLEVNKRYPIFETFLVYQKCNKYGAIFLNGVENVLHDTNLFIGGYDLTHPNENGRNELASAIFQSWRSGVYKKNYQFSNLPFTYGGDATSGNLDFKIMIVDNNTYLNLQGNRKVYFSGKPSYTDIHDVDIKIGELTLNTANAILSPWPYNMYPIPVTCAVEDSNSGHSRYRTMNGKLQFIRNDIILRFEDVESTNWTDITELISIEINAFSKVIPTVMC